MFAATVDGSSIGITAGYAYTYEQFQPLETTLTANSLNVLLLSEDVAIE